jgi:hypothetical protein
MIANIGYNVVLVLVIKHGSAALMYITSTIVLPLGMWIISGFERTYLRKLYLSLGTICFTFKFLLGEHAQDFNWFNGGGLAVVMFGMFCISLNIEQILTFRIVRISICGCFCCKGKRVFQEEMTKLFQEEMTKLFNRPLSLSFLSYLLNRVSINSMSTIYLLQCRLRR